MYAATRNQESGEDLCSLQLLVKRKTKKMEKNYDKMTYISFGSVSRRSGACTIAIRQVEVRPEESQCCPFMYEKRGREMRGMRLYVACVANRYVKT